VSIGVGSVKTFGCCKCRFQKKQRNNTCQTHILITCRSPFIGELNELKCF